MTPLEVVGLVTGTISIIGTIIAIVIRLTWYKAERNIRKLENDNEKLEGQVENLISKQFDLIQSLGTIKKGAQLATELKNEIDNELKRLESMLGANASSILVPYPPSRNSKFVFLSIAGPEAGDLKHALFDINKGIAGYVFSQGKSTYDNNVSKNPRWYGNVDKRIRFQTINLLCLPLKYGDRTVGVIQFLNKPDGFTESDKELGQGYVSNLGVKVAQFSQKIENFDVLGLAHTDDAEDGTVLVVDLTSSSSLLRGAHPIPLDDVLILINEYLEKLIDIGFRCGGILDKPQWDGFIMSFNVIKKVPNHQRAAVQSALQMNKEFDTLKNSWLEYGFPVERMFNRVAISSGVIHEVHMGHPQYRSRTVIGDPVVIASTLCVRASRDKNVIYLDPTVKKKSLS